MHRGGFCFRLCGFTDQLRDLSASIRLVMDAGLRLARTTAPKGNRTLSDGQIFSASAGAMGRTAQRIAWCSVGDEFVFQQAFA